MRGASSRPGRRAGASESARPSSKQVRAASEHCCRYLTYSTTAAPRRLGLSGRECRGGCVVSDDAYRTGKQIFISYGASGNFKMLLQCGVCLDGAHRGGSTVTFDVRDLVDGCADANVLIAEVRGPALPVAADRGGEGERGRQRRRLMATGRPREAPKEVPQLGDSEEDGAPLPPAPRPPATDGAIGRDRWRMPRAKVEHGERRGACAAGGAGRRRGRWPVVTARVPRRGRPKGNCCFRARLGIRARDTARVGPASPARRARPRGTSDVK